MEEQKEMKLKVDKTIWKEMFRYLSIFKKDFLILCGFMVGLAGMDIVFPLLTRYAIDTFVANGDYKGLTMVGVLYGCGNSR